MRTLFFSGFSLSSSSSLSNIKTQAFLVCSFFVVSEAKENLMAEALTKASLVSSWHGSSQRHQRRVSMVPNSCSFVSGVGRFPSLKLKSQILRSWSSSSEFQGKKLIFHVNRGIPNRVSSRLRASTAVQVCYMTTPCGFYYTLNLNFFFFRGIRSFLLPGVSLTCVTFLFPSFLYFSF